MADFVEEQEGISPTPPKNFHVSQLFHKCSGLGVLGVRRALSLERLQARIQVAVQAYDQRFGEEVTW